MVWPIRYLTKWEAYTQLSRASDLLPSIKFSMGTEKNSALPFVYVEYYNCEFQSTDPIHQRKES